MAEITSKSKLGIVLSSLCGFKEQSIELEQYTTESELAADIIWYALLQNHIRDKTIVDAGCGNGILGLGALLLGSKKVFFVEVSAESLEIAKKNYKILKQKYDLGKAIYIEDSIDNFQIKVDCVLQNPPFGTKKKHADRLFLEKGFEVADVIYSFHKFSTKNFIVSIAKDFNFCCSIIKRVRFPIKAVHKFHARKKYNVDVGIWLFKKCMKINQSQDENEWE